MNYAKTYYESINQYAKKLSQRIAFLEQKQNSLPAETIKYISKGKYVQYYLRKPNHQIDYIPAKQKNVIEPLVQAAYVRRALIKLRKNYKAAQRFLALHSKMEEFEIAESFPLQMQKINNNLFPCRELAISKWQNKPYKRNPYMPENLIHSTDRGDKMRSKSEVLIANRTYAKAIPYKPEAPVFLKTINKTVYPDFLLLNPFTLEEVIWEHFGLMSDPDYARNTCRKIQIYLDNGYILGQNFIASFESEGAPLTTNYIDQCINSVFRAPK